VTGPSTTSETTISAVEGKNVVDRCRALLEHRLADLVQRSGVSYADYARGTRLLLDALNTRVVG
jgi:hypothetical protein